MKTFGHQRPVRDTNGNIVEHKISPAKAVTRDALDGSFGADRGRKLIVSLDAGDVITIRAAKTQRAYTAKACDVYRWMIHCRANTARLEKARAAKSRKAERLASQRVARADRKLKLELRKERDGHLDT